MKNSGVEWIGEIPENWEVKRGKELFFEINDRCKNPENYPLLSVSEYYGVAPKSEKIDEGDFITHAETLDGYKICQEGDIVQNIMLAWKRATGMSNYEGLISPAYCIYRPFKGVDSKYYHYLFRTDVYADLFKQFSTGIIDSRLRLYPAKFLSLKYAYPPKSTQQRIASYLDKKCNKIEETIQNQRQVIEKLKAYKQSLITEAVTGKIKIQNGKVCGKYESYKDSGVEYLGKIPSNWNIKRLRYIGKCQNGISKGGEFFGSGYPFVSYGDVYNNLTLPETVSGLIESTPEEQENYSVMAGDIFFTRTSETIEEVGFTSVCLKTIEKATFAGFVIRVRPFTEELVPDYSKYYFSSDAHRRFFVKEMNLVTRASLSQDLLKRLPILIPSKDEQKEIADYLDKKCTSIDAAIEQKQKLIEKLTEYKKSLIYECVTGKKEI